MAHYKPKAATPIYSEARMALLREPWLTYPQVWQKMINPCVTETVSVYGSSIRHEIGCELRSIGGKEVLEVDYDKYLAACSKYAVRPLTLKTLLKASSPKRQIVARPEQLEEIVPQMANREDAQAVVDQMAETLQELMSSDHPNVMAETQTITVTETIHLGGDVNAKKAKLTKAFEEAELRMTDAGLELRGLESQRKDLLDQLAALDEKIASQRQVIDQTMQAMDVMLELVDAPDAVIDMVL